MNKAQQILNQITEIDNQIKSLLDTLIRLKEKRRLLRQELSKALIKTEPTISKSYRKSPKTQKDEKVLRILSRLDEKELSRLAEAIVEVAKQ